MATNNITTKAILKTYFNTNDKPTEDQFQELINSILSMGSDSVVTISDSATYSLETDDANGKGPGKTFLYNGVGDVIFNLPSVDSTNLGLRYKIVNASSSKLTIQTADTDRIDDSGEGATIYSGENSEQSSSSSSSEDPETDQPFASIELMLCEEDWWHVLQGRKTWTTTEFV